jgi:uncharacterized protein (DUF952 family)
VIYKLLRGGEWSDFQERSLFTGSPVDRADGFIHFSTAEQVRETAAKHFAGESCLVLAEVDPSRLSPPPVWEPSRGGAPFPHLYASLPLAAVVRTWIVDCCADGRHAFPDDLA